jgi:hypothetical protein
MQRERTLLAAAVAAVLSCMLPPAALADVNRTSISVPLIGTQGVAGPYPSRMVVEGRGPTEGGFVHLTLHAVRHPCPEDLAILLVHNGTEKYLLLSNAGGCRPLQGTNLQISLDFMPLPDSQPTTPAYGSFAGMAPSNYGTPPVFPAPAPPGPYTNGLPPVSTPVAGTWDLYVMDVHGSNHGAIAGGWSFGYPTNVLRAAPQVNVALPPFGGNGAGPAASYPITFDMSDLPAGMRVVNVNPRITLTHTFAADVFLVLQSPSGTAVALMANAGGNTAIAAGTELTFEDLATNPLPPAAAPIPTGVYRPSAYFVGTLAPPGPPGPYSTALAAFVNEPARGIWRLWAFDDGAGDTGQITRATLNVFTERGPHPQLTSPPATSTQPFIRLKGVDLTAISPQAVTWRVTNGGAFYDAGPFLPDPDGPNGFLADIPLKRGENLIEYTSLNVRGESQTGAHVVTVSEFTYSFAEGATGDFFDLDLTLANPTGTAAPIVVDLLPEGGTPFIITPGVPANAPLQLPIDDFVTGAVSSVVHSTNAVPLAAERTMIWDATGYGGHGGSAAAPDRRWLFAEGSQGFFDTFVLLANDNAAAATVALTFLVEGGSVVTVPVTVPAKARRTIYAGSIPALVNRSFGLDVTSSIPIIAERAMYLPGRRVFEGGHESAGVNSPSRVWFLAEGATGSFFDCFILLSNPNDAPAHARMTYLLPTGATIARDVVVPANGRLTINVETVDPALAAADVSTTIVSDVGIVAERAMYWPDISQGWREAHNSFGITDAALRWGLADGRIGGPRSYQTFVLLANPNALPAAVDVFFLKPGSTVARSYVLAPLSRRNIFVNSEVPELGDGVFGVDVQVRNFQPIAVEKALYWNAGAEVFAGGTNVTATRLPPP